MGHRRAVAGYAPVTDTTYSCRGQEVSDRGHHMYLSRTAPTPAADSTYSCRGEHHHLSRTGGE